MRASPEPHRSPCSVRPVLIEDDRPGVGLDHLSGRSVSHLVALFEPDDVIAHVDDGPHRVRDDDYGLAVPLEVGEALEAFALERLVTDGQDLVDEEYVGLHVDGHREPEPHVHTGRVVLYRFVDELADPGKVDDVIEAGQRALFVSGPGWPRSGTRFRVPTARGGSRRPTPAAPTSCPSPCTDPLSGRRILARHLSIVDLPEPFSPIRRRR